MRFLIKIFLILLQVIYYLIRLFPTENKVSFISRQADTVNPDFTKIAEELKREDSSVKTVFLCRRLTGGIGKLIGYGFHMFTQMYHVATSRVVVLDSYCIVVSCLRHKKSLKVIQMWHAVGCLKKFGFSVLDKDEGSDSRLASAMHMHENYDYVLCSSDDCKKPFAEAFNVPLKKMYVAPLPRIDELHDVQKQKDIHDRIMKQYPQLAGKKTIVYVPTFRKDEEEHRRKLNELIDRIDYDRYNFVIKLHPLSEISAENGRAINDRSYSSIEWGSVCDIAVTDYSAIVYEMATLGRPICFWCFDRSEYVHNRDFYTPYDELPGPKCETIDELLEAIENNRASAEESLQFSAKYIDGSIENYTRHICSLINELKSH